MRRVNMPKVSDCRMLEVCERLECMLEPIFEVNFIFDHFDEQVHDLLADELRTTSEDFEAFCQLNRWAGVEHRFANFQLVVTWFGSEFRNWAPTLHDRSMAELAMSFIITDNSSN